MNNQKIIFNDEQRNKTNVLANQLSFDSVSSSTRTNLGIRGRDSIKFGVKPQGTSIPKSVDKVVHKPPIQTIKIPDFFPKKNRLRVGLEDK